MARYHFSLEGVLRYRRFREEEELRRLAAAYRRRRRAEEELAARHRELSSRQEELSGSHWVLAERLHQALYLDFLARRVQEGRTEVERIRQEVGELERRAARAAQERRALERLKERRLEQWRYEEGRCSQREADEMVLLRYSRAEQNREGGGVY
jgi:flagellar export protein FliJ